MQASTKRLTVTIGILIGMFLAALEATVVGTAMPTVIATLGGLEIYSWVFSAYLLASTVTVPAWGKLSDVHGRRPLYLAAVSIFLVGSVLSGQAQTMAQLIVFRTIQGLGAGGLLPLAMTIIAELYTPTERARIQGYFSGVWGLASIVGPLVGGVITEQLDWRWVFYLNVPFGLLAAAIIGTQLIEDGTGRERRKVDASGILTFTASVTLFMLLLVRNETGLDLGSPTSLLFLVGSILTMTLFLRIEKGADEPLIPMDLLRNRVFSGVAINGLFSGMAMFGLISFIPLFVQGVLGTGATEAGSVLTPLLLGWVIFSVIGARLLLWIAFRWVMLGGMILMVGGFLLLDTMGEGATTIVILRNVGMIGCGMGLVMITGLIAVQSAVPRERLGIATSTAHFFRSIGGALGVAVMGTAMVHRLNSVLAGLMPGSGSARAEGLRPLLENPNAFLEPAGREALSPELVSMFQSVLGQALHSVFLVGTVVSIVGLVAVALMPAVTLKHFERQ